MRCTMQYRDDPLRTMGYRIIHLVAENGSIETVFTQRNVYDDTSENYSDYQLAAHAAEVVDHRICIGFQSGILWHLFS